MKDLAAQRGYRGPRMVALRFGTVVGVSPSQKTEYVHVGMVRSALMKGRITVWHSETWRAFLWINGDERFEVPMDDVVGKNFAPHIPRLVPFLKRVATLQSQGADGDLPGGLPLLTSKLRAAVEGFVSECASDMPSDWVGFCSATARPPATEVHMQKLRDQRKDPEAIADKLQAVFSLLYITKWRLWVNECCAL